MHATLRIGLLAWALVLALGGAESATLEPYALTEPSADGIGKWHLGREIAQVMGHEGAEWLDRPEREEEERPALVVDTLRLRATDVVADIGAGTSYFSLRLAAIARRVYAVDIQPEMLALLRAKAADAGVANIEPVLGTIDDPRLPAASIDLALFVDVYHELEYPVELMNALRVALRPGGRVALVEYRAEDPDVPIKPLHTMSEAQARLEMASLGFEWVETIATLPRQHLLVFRRP
ncbi:MAG TPA: class I SAM-dependent methyltransferase [Planctomycetota bacterium]|nr:class I SAM-dependent methyltransferase [Planctomycetota bacterium]